MTKKNRVLIALAKEVVAIYGGKASKPASAPTEELPPPALNLIQGRLQLTRRLTVSETYDGRRTVSLLRLKGRWLEQAGFPAGARVVVQVQEGRIVLSGQ